MTTSALEKARSVKVSVVVPCRNEIGHILHFLQDAFRQEAEGMDLEILIADGMSDDGTRQVLHAYEREREEMHPAFRVIDNFETIASTGLNAAIRAAQGEIIVRMDVHTDYAPDYIRNCVETLMETNADNVGGPAQTRSGDGYWAQAIAVGFHSPFASGGAKFRNTGFEGHVDTVPYGCWRKSTLEKLGLFDEKLVRGQDDELNLRILASGGKIWQTPKIISWYRPRTSLPSLFRQYFQYGFWKAVVIRKHRKPASWRNMVPGLSLFTALTLLFGIGIAGLFGLAHMRDILFRFGITLICLYASGSIFTSLLAVRKCGWKLFPLLPVVFAAYHLSYGLGSLLGFSCDPRTWVRPSSVQKALTEITR